MLRPTIFESNVKSNLDVLWVQRRIQRWGTRGVHLLLQVHRQVRWFWCYWHHGMKLFTPGNESFYWVGAVSHVFILSSLFDNNTTISSCSFSFTVDTLILLLHESAVAWGCSYVLDTMLQCLHIYGRKETRKYLSCESGLWTQQEVDAAMVQGCSVPAMVQGCSVP